MPGKRRARTANTGRARSCPSGRPRPRSRGQALTEFALVVPVLIAIVGGIVQFGVIFWAQNTLTQVVRDTGRWAATQNGCSLASVGIAAEANAVAGTSSLIGYTPGQWSAQDDTATQYGASGDTAVNGFSSPESIAVAWVKDSDSSNQGCPPKNNQAVYHVTIKINHSVPIFFPGMQFLPGIATCSGSPCANLSSTAQFRMEPAP